MGDINGYCPGWVGSRPKNSCLQERSENLITEEQDLNSTRGRNKEKKENMEEMTENRRVNAAIWGKSYLVERE